MPSAWTRCSLRGTDARTGTSLLQCGRFLLWGAMTWKLPGRLGAGCLSAYIAHTFRKLSNRTPRLLQVHNKAPRAYAREAIADAEAVIRQARAVMRPS